MSTPIDHARSLPPSVVARCAAADCTGRQAVGSNDLAADSYEEFLADLRSDMAASRTAAFGEDWS